MTKHPILTGFLSLLTAGLCHAAVSQVGAVDRPVKEPGFVYIASFNVYALGGIEDRYTSLEGAGAPELPLSSAIPDRIRNVARVIAVGEFDLVVLQEVHEGAPGRAAVTDLARVLDEEHGIPYRFVMSDGIGYGFIPEAVAFLYRPGRVRHETVNDTGSASVTIDVNGRYSTDPKPPRDLVQTQWEAGHFDFTLVSVHLAWGNHDKRRAGYEKVREIFARPSDWSDDPDVIVLGDFNRFGDSATAIEALPYDSGKFRAPNITFFDSAFSSRRQVTRHSIEGKGVPDDEPQLLSTTVSENRHVYDAIMFSHDAGEEFPAGLHEAKYGVDFGIIHFDHPTGFGFQKGADTLSHNELKEAYSDHRPLWIRFRTDLRWAADD